MKENLLEDGIESMALRYLRLFVFTIIVAVLGQASLYSTTNHVIYYDEAYEDEAIRLQAICQDTFGLSTSIIEINSAIAGIGDVKWPLPLGTSETNRARFFGWLRGDIVKLDTGEVVVGDTRTKVLEPFNLRIAIGSSGTTEYITLLGNSTEIPPSATYGFGDTDYFYSIVDNAAVLDVDQAFEGFSAASESQPTDYVPVGAVSRIPSLVKDASEINSWTVDTSRPSNTILTLDVPVGTILAVDELVGERILISMAFLDEAAKVDASGSFYPTITGHTRVLPNNTIKVVISTLSTTPTLNSSDLFPHFVEYRNSGFSPGDDPTASSVGSFAYLDPLFGSVTEVFDPEFVGNRTFVVGSGNSELLLKNRDREPSVEFYDSVNSKVHFNAQTPDVPIDDYFLEDLSVLGAGINSGDRSILLRMESGSLEGYLYPVVAYELSELGRHVFTIDGIIGDGFPTKAEMESASFSAYDMTETRDEILATFQANNPVFPFPGEVSYVSPANLWDPGTKESRVSGSASTVDLRESVSDYVDKVEAWVKYVWEDNEGKSDYFHNAMVMAQSTANRWDYPNEQTAISILNSRDASNSTNPSIFNGFRMQKVFQSNDGTTFPADPFQDRLRSVGAGGLGNQDVLDAMHGKGIVFATGSFQDTFGDTSLYTPTFYPDNNSGKPDLPLFVNAGAPAYTPFYGTFNYYGISGNVSDTLFALLEEEGELTGYNEIWGSSVSSPHVSHYVMDGENTDGEDFRGFIAQIGSWGRGSSSAGFLDKGYMSPYGIGEVALRPSFELGREVIREFNSADQPRLGSLWRESIFGYLTNKALREGATADRESLSAIAASSLNELMSWGCLGMSALSLPPHLQFQPTNTSPPLADEVPQPLIAIESSGLREEFPYDRFETPLVEVPNEANRNGNINVRVRITNMDSEVNDSGQTTSLGFRDYDPDTRFRATLIVLPLDQPYQDSTQYSKRISEMDFDGLGTPDAEDVFEVQIDDDGLGYFDFDFYEHWESNGDSVTKRGPGMFMVKVEAEEKARPNGDIYDSQKEASFTKENRFFFKVVNEFSALEVDSSGQYVRQPETPFLLVNNTDHDPYMQGASAGLSVGTSGDYYRYAPSVAIRFYEDALDNYQYSKGSLQKDSVGPTGLAKLYATEDSMQWENRVFPGDRIRVLEDDSVSYGPWFRITNVASDSGGAYIEVKDRDNFFLLGDFAGSRYVAQRAYTFGHAELTYQWADVATEPQISSSVKLVIPDLEDQGFSSVVEVGDFFKLLDGRSFVKIQSIGSGSVNADGDTEYTIILEDDYPFETLYHYHSQNDTWGGGNFLEVGGGTIRGSYAIYPPDENVFDAEEPSYLYKTWNVHNFVTNNFIGQGVHGDVSTGVLDAYSEPIDGVLHSAVIWANDMGYGEPIGNYKSSDRDLDGSIDTDYYPGGPLLYFSDRDLIILSGFMGQGGRVMTGGSYVEPNDDAFYTSVLGIATADRKQYGIMVKEDNDPIANVFENEVAIGLGRSENTGSDFTIEDEILNTHETGQFFELTVGKSQPVFNGTGAFVGSGPTMVRMSGGPNSRPYATVFMGFDFSNVSYSGVLSEFADLSDGSVYEGRNLLMKKSLDWLRDPTRTADDQQVRLTYFALNQDGTKTSILMDLGENSFINDALHVREQSSEQLTGVGPNQELSFSVSGGEIYENAGGYQWNIIGQAGSGATPATWDVDPSEQNNEDNHKIIFTTGSASDAEYRLQLVSPDGGVYSIVIQTARQPLLFSVANDGELVVNDSTMWSDGRSVNFVASGGDGLGSYIFSISPGDPSYTGVSLLDGTGGTTYTMPSLEPESEIQVPVIARSGSSTETATLTILPPLSFTNTDTPTHVIGGDPASLTATGGTGLSSGYAFSSTDTGVVLVPTSDGIGVAVSLDSATATASENPASPSTVTISAEDNTFPGAAAVSTTVEVYAPPRALYQDAGGTFSTLEDQAEITVDSSGVIPLSLVGGSGNFVVRVAGSTYASTTNVIRRLSSTVEGEYYADLATNPGFSLTYTSAVSMELLPGTESGAVTLQFSSGGSITQVTVTMTVPLVAEIQLPDETETSTYTSGTVSFPTASDNVTDYSLAVGLSVGTPPFTVTSDGLQGGFVDQDTYDAWVLSNSDKNPSLSSSIQIVALDALVYFFTEDQSEIDGEIRIADGASNELAIPIGVTGDGSSGGGSSGGSGSTGGTGSSGGGSSGVVSRPGSSFSRPGEASGGGGCLLR